MPLTHVTLVLAASIRLQATRQADRIQQEEVLKAPFLELEAIQAMSRIFECETALFVLVRPPLLSPDLFVRTVGRLKKGCSSLSSSHSTSLKDQLPRIELA